MESDHRLYVIEAGWRVAIKPDDGRPLYCFSKTTESAGHPRIAAGEIYLTNDVEVFNLNAAIERKIVSRNRPTLEGRSSGV